MSIFQSKNYTVDFEPLTAHDTSESSSNSALSVPFSELIYFPTKPYEIDYVELPGFSSYIYPTRVMWINITLIPYKDKINKN